MIIKITIICGFVVLIPFLYLLKVKLSQVVSFPQLHISNPFKNRVEKGSFTKDKPSIFQKLFEHHFHPETGHYEDPELRGLVYQIYGDEVKENYSYKRYWRKFSSRFSERAGDTKFTESERKSLSAYFRTNFKHYNEVITP